MSVLDKVKGLFQRRKTMPEVPSTPPPPPPVPQPEPQPEVMEAETMPPPVEPVAEPVEIEEPVPEVPVAPFAMVTRTRPMDQAKVQAMLNDHQAAVDAKVSQAIANLPQATVPAVVAGVEQVGNNAVILWTASGFGILQEVVLEDGGAVVELGVVKRT